MSSTGLLVCLTVLNCAGWCSAGSQKASVACEEEGLCTAKQVEDLSNDDPGFLQVITRARAHCEAINGTQVDILRKVKPCGFYRDCGFTILNVSTTYPGQGALDPKCGEKYVAQFDIGRYPNETCYEGIVRNCDNWGNLGMDNVSSGKFDAMGRCGAGTMGVGDAYDCLKHDLCTAYVEADPSEPPASGYCDDPRCGDEGAQAVFNCRSRRWWRSKKVACTCDGSTWGSWSPVTKVWGGNCRQFQGCAQGQGIPNRAEMR